MKFVKDIMRLTSNQNAVHRQGADMLSTGMANAESESAMSSRVGLVSCQDYESCSSPLTIIILPADRPGKVAPLGTERMRLETSFKPLKNTAHQDRRMDSRFLKDPRARHASVESSLHEPEDLRSIRRRHARRGHSMINDRAGLELPSEQTDESVDETEHDVARYSAPQLDPKHALKTYERRPRHKTKEDRYEVKAKKKEEKSGIRDRPTGRRNPKPKSSAALAERFTSEKVTKDRLTVS